MEWVKFYSQHRKLGYNVILVAQNDRMIDRQIRALIEYEIKHRKANNFGTIGMFIPVPFFAAVNYWYGVRERIGVEFFTYKKKYSKLYDSYAIFDESSELLKGAAAAVGGEESAECGGDTATVAVVPDSKSEPNHFEVQRLISVIQRIIDIKSSDRGN